MLARTDGLADGWTNTPEGTCPSNFYEVGGIINIITRAASLKQPYVIVEVFQ